MPAAARPKAAPGNPRPGRIGRAACDNDPMLQFEILATEGLARRGRLTLIRHLLDHLPDTDVPPAPLEFPPLGHPPEKERFGRAPLKPLRPWPRD